MKLITVPLSQAALVRLDYDTNEDGDLCEIALTDYDYTTLWEIGVLEELNEKLGIMIDDYEDESITMEQLAVAKKIVSDYAKHKQSVKPLLDLLNQIILAEQKHTGVFFYF